MRRTPVLVLLAALLGTAAPAATAQDASPPPLRAALAACGAGATADERFAVFTGSMPTRPGARRMAMRFDLLERRGATATWQRVPAPAFGRWERSRPGRAGFVYTKRVERLRENADYRAVVRFRWYDAAGRVQRAARRGTPVCEQPDRRPDLTVLSVRAVAGDGAGTSRYLVTVANTGLTAAGPFELGLVAGGAEEVRRVDALASGERTTVEVPGRRCTAAEPATVTVDVRGAVDEADERDNAFRAPCDGR